MNKREKNRLLNMEPDRAIPALLVRIIEEQERRNDLLKQLLEKLTLCIDESHIEWEPAAFRILSIH